MDVDAALVRRLFDYDPETGALTWKARNPDMFTSSTRFSPEVQCAQWNTRFAGTAIKAVTGNDDCHLKVTIFGHAYKAHRIIWLWMTGKWPDAFIDHANGNGHDNRWSNLRLATNAQNIQNSKTPITNTSGVKGVHFDRRDGRWKAQIGVAKKRIHLGSFTTRDAAAEAYKAAAEKHFGEYARMK